VDREAHVLGNQSRDTRFLSEGFRSLVQLAVARANRLQVFALDTGGPLDCVALGHDLLKPVGLVGQHVPSLQKTQKRFKHDDKRAKRKT
jgi:hypothetical protein